MENDKDIRGCQVWIVERKDGQYAIYAYQKDAQEYAASIPEHNPRLIIRLVR